MFRRRNSEPEPTRAGFEPVVPPVMDEIDELTDEEAAHGPDVEQFTPENMRAMIFDILAKRVGPEMAESMREDFDKHVAEEAGALGVEQAYVCLFGKLIGAIDRMMELYMTGKIEGDQPDPKQRSAVADFEHFN